MANAADPGGSASSDRSPDASVPPDPRQPRASRTARTIHDARWGILHSGAQLLQAAVAIALFILGLVVLVRTMATFLDNPSTYPTSIVSALDGILVVIIVVDILQTVLTHLRSATLPVRPFLIIGILAGVRDILSASARLTLNGRESPTSFRQSIIELSIGVGVVVLLPAGLLLLRAASGPDGADET